MKAGSEGGGMIIGVPKEVKDQEFRVSVTPDGVRALVQAGHVVWVEPGAGAGTGFSDDEYRKAGAHVATNKAHVFDESEMIVKVKEPVLAECPLFKSRHVLFTYLHLAAVPEVTRALLETGVTGIAYETTEDSAGNLPMLKPMSEIAGRMAVQVGARYLERLQGGSGVLLGGVPGVAPANVVVLGAGIVGCAAAQIAVGMGARVTVINLDIERLRHLDELYRGRIVTLASNQAWIDQAVTEADLVIGAVLVRGAKAPRLVSRSVISNMRPGSVVVDVSVDQGGCFETTRVTTHSDPVYLVDGVLHYCVANMPGIVPRTATFALTNATLPFIVRIASAGLHRAIKTDPGLAKGVNLMEGRVTCKAVAEAHGLPYHPLT
jgi:alanine dehydrogenase